MARENVRAKARGLGAELADLREQSGLTLREVAERLGWSAPTLSRIENGKRDSSPEEIASLLVVYKITGARNDRMVSMAKTIDQSGWWEFTDDGLSRHLTALRAFESEATRLTDVAMILVPGLLQTPEYARAVMEATGVDQIDDRVAIRVGRQAVLCRRRPPELHAIIDETALRRPLGGAEIMAAQLRRLVQEAARPYIIIQVLRHAKYPALAGSYYTLEFPAPAPPFALLENLTSSAFLDDEDAVRTFQSTTVTLSQQGDLRNRPALPHPIRPPLAGRRRRMAAAHRRRLRTPGPAKSAISPHCPSACRSQTQRGPPTAEYCNEQYQDR